MGAGLIWPGKLRCRLEKKAKIKQIVSAFKMRGLGCASWWKGKHFYNRICSLWDATHTHTHTHTTWLQLVVSTTKRWREKSVGVRHGHKIASNWRSNDFGTALTLDSNKPHNLCQWGGRAKGEEKEAKCEGGWGKWHRKNDSTKQTDRNEKSMWRHCSCGLQRNRSAIKEKKKPREEIIVEQRYGKVQRQQTHASLGAMCVVEERTKKWRQIAIDFLNIKYHLVILLSHLGYPLSSQQKKIACKRQKAV